MSVTLRAVVTATLLLGCGVDPNGPAEVVVLDPVAAMGGAEEEEGSRSEGDDPAADPDTEVESAPEPEEDPEPAAPAIEIPVAPTPTGACPTFSNGTHTIEAAGFDRRVNVFLPNTPEGAPVLFIWHGLGDSANGISNAFGAERLAIRYNAIIVVPHSSGRFQQSEWAFFGGDAAVDAELFDETLGCLSQTLSVDMDRIYTTGFSAGALWSTWLLMNRSEYFAAVVLFSGGTGFVNPYSAPSHSTPVLAFYGGPRDVFGGGVINFAEMTTEMVGKLVVDGHDVVLCNHDGGHTIPLDPNTYALPFLFEHTFSMAEHPYAEALGPRWADFCEILGD